MSTIYTILFILISANSIATDANAIDYIACFEPHGQCENKIIEQILYAKTQILVQAYSFTNPKIAKSLIKAKDRGVDVEILLDKSQLKSKRSVLPYFKNKNIPIRIDYRPAIAHNKIIIIDNRIVITGSYNFTINADKRNAENLIIIFDNKLAHDYVINWQNRNRQSKSLITF